MEHLYIDESGSMTVSYCDVHPYFIIAVVRVKNVNKLKQVHSRFVSKHIEELRECNARRKGSMFRDGRFSELKGAFLSPELKRSFVDYLCRNDLFEIFYIVADNSKVSPSLYENTARGFNYLLKLALGYWFKQGYLCDDGLLIQIDERNEKTESKHFLETYLNTEFLTSGALKHETRVTYFDSSKNRLIQIADVFANLLYSDLKTGSYSKQFDYMKDNGYLRHIFRFPL